MVSSSSSSSSHNWEYDVFLSFRGEDVRISFISHLHLALGRKLISAFKDTEIERGLFIGTKLAQTIKDSRIAIVVFSGNYASSSWCLNELAEIMKCKDQLDVIPIFYGLDPSHVRNQTGEFGKTFENTCQEKTEAEKELWEEALTNIGNIAGYHSLKWDNEASMIEAIIDDVLVKLKLTPSMDFSGFVGMEDHIANMSLLLRLESEEVLLPSKSLALKMFCQSAFGQNSPPMRFAKMAYEVTECAGSLPLGLNILGCTKLETLPSGINLESLSCLILDECSLLRSLPDISDNISILSLENTFIKKFPSKWRLVYLVHLNMDGIKNEKLWEGVKLLPVLEIFTLSSSKNLKEIPDLSMAKNLNSFMINNCQSLVEIPSFRLNNLKELRMRICSSLRTFPDFSANISELSLDGTMIEEVPWWIEKFSKLETLTMPRCIKLKYVPPNIYKLHLLEKVDFSNCGALTEASWHGCSSVVSSLAKNCYPKFKVNFINCLNLDQETLIQQKSAFKLLILPGEEVPPYFTHQTNGSIITIPLLLQNSLSQQFFGYRACLAVEMDNSEWYHGHIKIDIHVQCYYKGKPGIRTDFSQYQDVWRQNMKGSHLVIFDYHFLLNKENSPSAELNCDEVDIKFHIDNSEILGCGVQLAEFWEGNESNDDNDHSDKYGDSYDSDLGSETDQSEEYEYSDDSDMGNETDPSEEGGDSDDCNIGSETDQSEEGEHKDICDISNETDDSATSGDSDLETKRSSKRRRWITSINKSLLCPASKHGRNTRCHSEWLIVILLYVPKWRNVFRLGNLMT
ncbi:hypothetical protein AALP_AA6G114900 [Arabis alpina]|uniref:TIR domain-containing protein n=1 Tax=Arabis alpina TaxID=50452 RepID=A0A087GNL1_ARAAL|nr:hypothetical protein AALP_AA6G114900 [Arabis alpina]